MHRHTYILTEKGVIPALFTFSNRYCNPFFSTNRNMTKNRYFEVSYTMMNIFMIVNHLILKPLQYTTKYKRFKCFTLSEVELP